MTGFKRLLIAGGILLLLVIRQPAPYRTEPWPFGEIKQAALYSDGTIGDCLSENAAH